MLGNEVASSATSDQTRVVWIDQIHLQVVVRVVSGLIEVALDLA